MKTLLVVRSSLFGESGQSARLADQFVQRWLQTHPEGRVVTRDVVAEPVRHLTAEDFGAFQTDEAGRSADQQAAVSRSDEYIRELNEADEIVIGLPMYNFGIPSQLKAWFDHLARAGVTFRYTENGPVGLVGDRKVTLLATRGGFYQGTEKDSQTRHVTDFLGLLGIASIEFVYAEGLGMGPEQSAKSLAKAGDCIDRLAA